MVIYVHILSPHLDYVFLQYRCFNSEFDIMPKIQSKLSWIQYILKQYLANNLGPQKNEKRDTGLRCLPSNHYWNFEKTWIVEMYRVPEIKNFLFSFLF